MKISILEMCQILLYKIRKLEQDIRDVLKINQKEVLFQDIEFIIEGKKMEERRKRNSMRSQMPNHPDPKKTKKKSRKRSTKRNNNQSRKQIKNQNQAQGNQQGPPQKRIPQERFNSEDVLKNITRSSELNDRDRNLEEDLKIKTTNQPDPKIQRDNLNEQKKIQQEKILKNNQEIADRIREEAKKEFNSRNYVAARPMYEEAQQYAPKDARIQANLCICAWHQEEYLKSFNIAQKIVSNEELEYRDRKLIYSMVIKAINSALVLQNYEVALKCTKNALIHFSTPELEKLLEM